MEMMLCDDGNGFISLVFIEMVGFTDYTYTYTMVNCTWTIFEIM
jgi:hypothetical protein